MTLARELASLVQHRALDDEMGAYYLGATTPDIRAITHRDRAETHFFDLKNFEHQSGVQGVFDAHPELAQRATLNATTVAFMCGYISHLEMDEAWITDVYRPCFGEGSPIDDPVLANVLDRALQFELDRRARQDSAALAAIRDDLIAASVEGVRCFIDHETLARWRDINADLLCQQPDWSRFAASVTRHLRAHGLGSDAEIEAHLRDIPALVEQSVREVTPERLEAFQERARGRAVGAMRAYLS